MPATRSMNLLAAMRYLVALDKHRHFGRAAQACDITQPALSNALRAGVFTAIICCWECG
jgi:hypothetical protein